MAKIFIDKALSNMNKNSNMIYLNLMTKTIRYDILHLQIIILVSNNRHKYWEGK